MWGPGANGITPIPGLPVLRPSAAAAASPAPLLASPSAGGDAAEGASHADCAAGYVAGNAAVGPGAAGPASAAAAAPGPASGGARRDPIKARMSNIVKSITTQASGLSSVMLLPQSGPGAGRSISADTQLLLG